MLHLRNQCILQAQHTSIGRTLIILGTCPSGFPVGLCTVSSGGDTPLPRFLMYLSRIYTLKEGSQFFHFCSASIVSLEIGKKAPMTLLVEKQLRNVGDVRAKTIPPHPPRDAGPIPSYLFENILEGYYIHI